MSYFKAPDNSVHFLDDDNYQYLLPAGSVVMSDAEVLAHNQAIAQAQASAQAQADAIKQDNQTALSQAKPNPVIQYLLNHTVAEAQNYVQTNVTDLASAKTLLVHIVTALSVLVKMQMR